MSHLLPDRHMAPFLSFLSEAQLSWKAIDSRLSEPTITASGFQKNWDYPVAELHLENLIDNAPTDLSRARLLAVSAPF
ncbi:MAG: hypothetical protein AAGK05_19495, partial [Pseudomonadota bacterium]